MSEINNIIKLMKWWTLSSFGHYFRPFMATLYWRIKSSKLHWAKQCTWMKSRQYGKEFLGLAPCHVTLRKPSAENPDYTVLIVLCPFFVNIPIIKNRVAKWKITLKLGNNYLLKNYINFGLCFDCLTALSHVRLFTISDQIHFTEKIMFLSNFSSSIFFCLVCLSLWFYLLVNKSENENLNSRNLLMSSVRLRVLFCLHSKKQNSD